jgi:hypothetical protein
MDSGRKDKAAARPPSPVKPNIPFEDMEIGLLHLIESCAELGWAAGAIQFPNL